MPPKLAYFLMAIVAGLILFTAVPGLLGISGFIRPPDLDLGRFYRSFIKDPPDPPTEAFAGTRGCSCEAPSMIHVSASLVEVPTHKPDGSCIKDSLVFCSLAYLPDFPRHGKFDFEERPEKAIDGMSFQTGGRLVQLWGIKAPKKGEPFFEEARKQLASEVEGRSLDCYGKGTTKDDTQIVRCFESLIIGASYFVWYDVSAEMVGHGYAADFAKESNGYYSKLEARAKADHEGMWAEQVQPASP